MKRYLLFLTGLLFTIPVAAQKQIVDKVIASVGTELVLLSEVEEQVALMKDQGGKIEPDSRCRILDNLLTAKLLLNQARIDSVEVTDEEVEEQLNARIDRILGYMNNDVQQFEAYYGQTINEVKDQQREDLKNQILIERMRSQVLNSVNVTPSEVRAFFEEIPADSLPYFNSEVEIGEIVYRPKVNPDQRQIAVSKLEEIRRRIMEDGESFSELAQKFSDDGSARAGGDLGWTKRGAFVPEFEAAAYKLEKDELSPVVESEFGFHLIQLLERRGNTIHVRHILVRPEITDEDIEKAKAHLDSVRQLILTDSIGFSTAVKKYSDEDAQSYNNDGRMINPMTGNTFFEIGDLEPDIYFTIDTMELNEVSAPIEFQSPTGETWLRLVQLQSRTDPHRANLQQDYSKIRQAAIESKKSEFIQGWIREKVDATYVEIDAIYNECRVLDIWRNRDIRP